MSSTNLKTTHGTCNSQSECFISATEKLFLTYAPGEIDAKSFFLFRSTFPSPKTLDFEAKQESDVTEFCTFRKTNSISGLLDFINPKLVN